MRKDYYNTESSFSYIAPFRHMTAEKFLNIVIICTVIFLVSSIVYLILGELLLPADKEFERYDCTYYEGEWNWIPEDGIPIRVTPPCRLDVPKGSTLVMETVIPDTIKNGDYFALKSFRQDMVATLDGKVVIDYNTKDERLFGISSPSAYLFIPLQEADAGKTLHVEASTTTTYSGMFDHVYYGTKEGIWGHIIRNGLWEVTIALIVLILGAFSFLFGTYIGISLHTRTALAYIGFMSMIGSLWILGNSTLRQLVFPNFHVVSDMPFFMLMLMPLPELLFVNALQNNRYRFSVCIFGYISVITNAFSILLYITGQLDLPDSAYLSEMVLGLCFVYSISTMILDFFNHHIREYYLPAIGMLLAFIMVSVQMLCYAFHIFGFDASLCCYAILFILTFTSANAYKEFRDWDRRKYDAINIANAKSQFLAEMSHEIRTPINAVLGMDEMILRESSEPHIREYAIDIQRAGQNLLALINDILDYSKIESKKLEIIPVSYELSSLINDSYNMVAVRAQKKGLEFHVDADYNLPRVLRGDEVRIRQVIINLLTNAIKYTEEGSVNLIIDGRYERDGTFYIRFTVKDSGIGIKEEDIQKLFTSFQRVDEQRNRNIEGTGLGLTIASSLVELMYGEMWVESVYGEGSTFFFEIPQEVLSNELLQDFSSQYEKKDLESTFREPFQAPDARVLVVDDVAVNLKVFTGLVKQTKIQVDTALSGEECLQLITQNNYDIIFLDHMMPKMDGLQTYTAMKNLPNNLNADTPVIMLTANAISGAKEQYISAGFVDYLSKPIQQNALDDILLTHLPSYLIFRNSEEAEE